LVPEPRVLGLKDSSARGLLLLRLLTERRRRGEVARADQWPTIGQGGNQRATQQTPRVKTRGNPGRDPMIGKGGEYCFVLFVYLRSNALKGDLSDR